jgi:hypothetical protein
MAEMGRPARLILLLLLLTCGCAMAAPEDTGVTLGRLIYEKGIGRDGREIEAVLHGGIALKGATVACAGCHGPDGRGRAEAFVQAPDIRWMNLSRRHAARRAGISAVPYDPASFARTLRSGLTAGGIRLDPVMPRFNLAEDEVKSLIAYLSIINVPSSKKEDHIVALGLLPMPGRNAAADMLAQKMQNCPTSTSKTRVAAIDILYFRDSEDAIAQLNRRIQGNPNSIILLPYLLGWEEQYIEASVHWAIPTVLPFSFLDPPEEESKWYYRFPGLQTQIKALLKHAKDNGHSRLVIVHDSHNALSVKLAAFSREAALQYKFQVVTDTEESDSGQRSAELWLTPVSKDTGARLQKGNELMLVPALFYGFVNVDGFVHKLSGSQLAIGYPFKPQRKDSHAWRTPIDVWGSAACEFLATIGGGTTTLKNLPNISLRWEQDLFLLPQPSEKELLDYVYIDEMRPQ